MAAYRVVLRPPAVRALERLPEKAATAIVEFVYGSLSESPYRVGKPLVAQLAGAWSARRGEYRVIYVVEEDPPTIEVLTIGHRRDVYARQAGR